MTKKQQKQILAYLRECANLMALRDWVLILGSEPPDDAAAAASVTPTWGRKHACFRFCSDFWGFSREVQREIVCHELVHLHFAAMVKWFQELENDGAITNHAGRAFNMNFEYGIDGVADGWSRVLPLPKFK